MMTAAATAPTALNWRPHPGQQERFLASLAFEALFGGAAGPGKTECLVLEALRQVGHPAYTGIIFRRTFPMLEAANGIIQRSLKWYPAFGGRYSAQKHYWVFPSGARIYFGHMEHDGDELQYQGAEFCFIGFDELSEFTEKQYLYLFTRCRVPGGGGDLRAYIRNATNPGNIGHQWVKRRFITRDIHNRLRWFALIAQPDGSLVDTEVDRSHPDALSRAFYPALLADNPSADPGYRVRIRASGDPVRIAQLEHGDWDAEHHEGLIYDTWSSLGWPDGNVSAEAAYRPDLPVYWACDDGYVYGEGPGHASYHPRVVLFVQDNEIGGLDVMDEYVACEETYGETLNNVLGSPDRPDRVTRWMAYRKPTAAYMPSEAAQFKGELHKRGISTVNATHRVTEGIKTSRQLDLGGDGVRRLRVYPQCSTLIYEKSAYRSDPKGRSETGEIIPLKQDDHTMDALRYLIFKRRHTTG
jgi:hypothetical protein